MGMKNLEKLLTDVYYKEKRSRVLLNNDRYLHDTKISNDFKKKYHLNFKISIPLSSMARYKDWCEEYCEGNFLIYTDNQYFTIDQDKLKFILRWS